MKKLNFKLLIPFAFLSLLITSACQPPQASAPDYSAREASIDKFLQAWNTNDASNLGEFLTDNFERWANGEKTASNLAEMKTVMEGNYAMSSDFKVTIGDYFHSGNMGFVSWNFSGTNDGPLSEEIPATGKSFSNDGFAIHTYSGDGKISKEEVYFDTWIMNQQLGFTMQPPSIRRSARRRIKNVWL